MDSKTLAKTVFSRTFKDAGIVMTGEVFNVGFAFLLTVLVSRSLGPNDFGLFSVALAVLTLVAGLLDLGVNTGMVRFASLALGRQQPQIVRRVLAVAFRFKFVLGLMVWALSYLLARPTAVLIFHDPALVQPIRLALTGVGGLMMLEFAVAALQAYQWFSRRLVINFVVGFGRLALVLVLLGLGQGNLNGILKWYVFWPWAGFFLSLFFIPPGYIWARWDRPTARDLFHFSKWIMLAGVVNIIFNRLDIFMLTALSGAQSSGLYAAAFRLASLLMLVSSALSTMLLPKVASLTSSDQIRRYFVRVLPYPLVIGLLCLPLFFFGRSLIVLIYGPAYAAAAGVFLVLLLAFILVVIAAPFNLILYALNRPQLLAVLAIGELAISVVGNYCLIPGLGAAGAAWTLLLVRVFTISFLLIYLAAKLSRLKQDDLSWQTAEETVLEEDISLGG